MDVAISNGLLLFISLSHSAWHLVVTIQVELFDALHGQLAVSQGNPIRFQPPRCHRQSTHRV